MTAIEIRYFVCTTHKFKHPRPLIVVQSQAKRTTPFLGNPLTKQGLDYLLHRVLWFRLLRGPHSLKVV